MQLNDYLIKHNISQVQFAKQLNVSSCAVNSWINATRTISFHNALKIAAITNNDVMPHEFENLHDITLALLSLYESINRKGQVNG